MNERRKKRFQWLIVGTICVATGLYGGSVAEAGPEAPTANPQQRASDELRIMGAVIEDSLDATQSGEWRGRRPGDSPFEAHVRVQYIPTVGAVFTVPVNFAIVDPGEKQPEVKAEKQADGAAQDLWEKNSQRDGVGPHGGGLGGGGGLGESYMADGPIGPAYSKEKVDALKSTLTEVLAKYGCKLENVKSDERVIVIVEAPGKRAQHAGLYPPPRFQEGRRPGEAMRQGPPPPGGGHGPQQGPPVGPGGRGPQQGPPQFDGRGPHDGPPPPLDGRGPHQGPPPFEGRGPQDAPPPARDGRGRQQGPPQFDGQGPPPAAGTGENMRPPFGGPRGPGAGQDHLLISAPKAALTAGQTKEGLEASIKVVSY